jgi:uncharacterized membrane protein YedE/YeeE
MKSKVLQLHLRYALLGLLLGIVLSYTGFANFDELHAMFMLANLRLLLTFLGAVAILMVGFVLLDWRRHSMPVKTRHPGTVPGSVLFGIGWALTGACPAVALVQLGQGYVAAAYTLLGIVLGIRLHKYLQARYFRWNTESCS